ncbi:peptidoglycan recognition protein family protein [Actinomadura sediminis]|uniref:Peptidoglycan recognition family protein n=1 Tax=Actinomadura sediminis TaxID=1038904 RepID=A0ABW3EVF0_9ACTN
MTYDGKHRSPRGPMSGVAPRRTFLLGGLLAAGAAVGVQELTRSPAGRAATGTGEAVSEQSRSRAPGNARRASATVPFVHPTAQWGADDPDREATVLSRPPKYVVVHHTSTDNVDDDSIARARYLARAIQNAHKDRGWGDTGQQFTISRGGHIMEGRTGSLAAAERGEMVMGTHVAGANEFTVGIECEGTYNDVLPPRRLRDSLVQLCAWLCEQYDLDPHDAIVPHKKFNDTDCCGDKFAPTLPSLRDDVASIVSPSRLR